MPINRPSDQDREIAARALWYVGARHAEIRAQRLPAPRAGELLARTLSSGLSRGTERLVFEGAVPQSEYSRMRAPMQQGDFPFPVKYGYCAVAIVEEGPTDLTGKRVFALHPHQDFFVAPADAATIVPDEVPSERAVLAANMETALNALWDSGVGPGDRIAIFGGGAVGLLICFLVARLPGAEATLIDPEPSRGMIARSFGAAFSDEPDAVRDADVVFHASATAAGLAAAIGACGMEGVLVEASWYGARMTEVALGGGFHSKRLKIVSSQVSQVSPSRRRRSTHRNLARSAACLRNPPSPSLVRRR